MKKNAQTVMEYMLIFTILSLGLFLISSNVNLKSIRNMVFGGRAADSSGTITIESMTGRD